jgi:glutamate:Na+ symporter, ESS family
MSLLLVGGQLLRSRSRLLQATRLPTAMIAGVIAIAAGPYAGDLLPFSRFPDGTPHLAAYPGYLIALIFAALPLARPMGTGSLRAQLRRVGDTFFYTMVSFVGQYAVALLFGLLVLGPLFPSLPGGFAVLLPAGWAGGFGTAAAIGTVLAPHGFENVFALGYTSATVGVTVGTIGGMVLIHVGTRRGWTRLVGSPATLDASFRTGFYPEARRASVGAETANAAVLDVLTWHLGLAGAALGLAHGVSAALPAGHGIPLFALALLTGWLVRWLLGLVGLDGTVDPRLMGRIGSGAADYLVSFGMASIAVTVVWRYVLPLSLLFALGLVLTLGVFALGRRMFVNFWFERSLFTYGWSTGVLATSIALLRVVDPKGRSRTMEDYGTAYLGNSFLELAIVALVPLLIVRGYVVSTTAGLLVITGVALLLSKGVIGWSVAGPRALRPGEAEVLASAESG